MKTVIISIDQKTLIPLFSSRVYKIAESLANDENFKTIYNIEHDLSDTLDTFLSNQYFKKRFGNVKKIVTEFIVSETTDQINLSVPSASIATSENASEAASDCIVSGMLSDWIKDTLPTLLKQYESAAISAENELKRVIYTKKAPEL